MQTAVLYIPVEFDPALTDAEGIANAADTLLATALSTPGVLDDYGNPTFGNCVIPTEAAVCRGIAKRLGRRVWQRAKGLSCRLYRKCIGSIRRRFRKDVTRTAKYLLYDFDASEMATTTVYDSFDEAKEDAGEFDNVIVIPLIFEEE